MSFGRVFKFLSFYSHRPCVSSFKQELKYCSKTNFLSSSETTVYTNTENNDEDDEEEEDLTKPLVKLTVFFSEENVEKQIEARVGSTVYKAILKHDNTLMQSACDGQLSCQTCHCLVEDQAMHYFSEAEDPEQDLLDAFANSQLNSRLACQMKILKEFKDCRIEIVPEIKKR